MWDQMTAGAPQVQPVSDIEQRIELPWVDQLAQNILLTVQAFQRLHAAWNTKFPS